MTPEPGRYYHVVGVWDKTAEKAYIYVDGQLKGTADAPGELIHAKDGARWFALGGDSAVGSMGNAWNGEVVLARVFDDALTGDQIALSTRMRRSPARRPWNSHSRTSPT